MQIKINNKNINYEVIGEGYPVVLLHGWLANIETMRPLANNLCNNYKVYLVDIIGFGKSELPDNPLTTNDFGDFLKSFLDELKIEKPVLIGHSNGGRCIINAVGRGLVEPKKIVLIDSAGLTPKERSTSYKVKTGIAKLGKSVLKVLPNGKELEEKLKNKMGSEDYKASPEVLKETMKIILNEDQRPLLSNIKVPTLLIWGSNDTATPISDAKEMEEAIPDCGLVEYPNSTHFSYLENLANVNAVLNEFLKDLK